MNTDQLRANFERKNPLPAGIHWDGDHYCGTKDLVGSFHNASIWNDMLRGYLQGWADCALVEAGIASIRCTA